MNDRKAEPDTEGDPARVDSRNGGDVEDDTFVGRIAGQDEGYAEETGAERRAESD